MLDGLGSLIETLECQDQARVGRIAMMLVGHPRRERMRPVIDRQLRAWGRRVRRLDKPAVPAVAILKTASGGRARLAAMAREAVAEMQQAAPGCQ